ncbi:unnamed protein product [Caenorhabditis nigoni]
MMPTPPLNLLPGMLPIPQFNPFYNLSRLAPMIMPPLLPLYPSANMQINRMNLMAMKAMTPQSQLNSLFSAALPTNIPMTPVPETMQTKSSFRIDTILSTGQQYPINQKHKKENHIKKPLNAFMLFVKENRKTLIEENGYGQMPAGEINKELGRRWKNMTDEERQKYFELSKIERELHKEKYPEWSARDNYAKKLKKGTQNMCRARFGIENKSKWCVYCLRKKKCVFSRVLSEINSANDEKTTSKISSNGTSSSSSSETTPIGLMLNQVALKLQAHAESITNSEATEEEL